MLYFLLWSALTLTNSQSGFPGATGITGRTGPTGDIGIGYPGSQGTDGKWGPLGETGPTGTKGESVSIELYDDPNALFTAITTDGNVVEIGQNGIGRVSGMIYNSSLMSLQSCVVTIASANSPATINITVSLDLGYPPTAMSSLVGQATLAVQVTTTSPSACRVLFIDSANLLHLQCYRPSWNTINPRFCFNVMYNAMDTNIGRPLDSNGHK